MEHCLPCLPVKPRRRYLIANSALQAVTGGLGYRDTKDMADKSKDKAVIEWGQVVQGVDGGDGWLKVGQHFLPMTIGEERVVTLAPQNTAIGQSDVHTAALPGRYLIANSALQAVTNGLGYRDSKDMADKSNNMAIEWGQVVEGVDEGDGWLKVGQHFLPMTLEGERVATLAQGLNPFGLSNIRKWASPMTLRGKRVQGPAAGGQWDTCSLASDTSFKVDNSALRSGATALGYRNTKDVTDKSEIIAGPKWGDVVEGTDEGDGWLKVGQHFLPMSLDGKRVVASVS